MNINYFDEENNQFGGAAEANESPKADAAFDENLNRAEAERKQALKSGYGFLGKWLWYYFILIIPSIIAGVFGAFTEVPIMTLIGNIISIAVSVVTILILYKLGDYDPNYRKAGLLQIPVFVVDLIGIIAFANAEVPLWFSGIQLIPALIGLYGTYIEFKTHAAVTAPVDPTLSENWTKLWKWTVICMVVTICSVFLLLIPVIGLLLMIFGAIGLVVCSIIKLVYLYRTAKLFQALSF